MTDAIQSLFEHLGQIVVDSIPEVDWQKIILTSRNIFTYGEQEAWHYKTNEARSISFGINDDDLDYQQQINPSFKKMRQLMYEESPLRGAWYKAEIEIYNDGKFNVNFNYDNPNFDNQPTNEEYVYDFQQFPRNKESTPEWLKPLLEKYKHKYKVEYAN